MIPCLRFSRISRRLVQWVQLQRRFENRRVSYEAAIRNGRSRHGVLMLKRLCATMNSRAAWERVPLWHGYMTSMAGFCSLGSDTIVTLLSILLSTAAIIRGKRRCGSAPVIIDGERRWVAFNALDLNTDDFHLIGEAFEGVAEAHAVHTGKVGLADCRLMRQRYLVAFAADWMLKNRN